MSQQSTIEMGQGRAGQKPFGAAWRPLLGGLCKVFAGRPLGAWEARARASQGNLKGHRGSYSSDWLACLSHAPAPGPVLGLLRCDCRAQLQSQPR